jgi:hypothetical protein
VEHRTVDRWPTHSEYNDEFNYLQGGERIVVRRAVTHPAEGSRTLDRGETVKLAVYIPAMVGLPGLEDRYERGLYREIRAKSAFPDQDRSRL